MSGCACVCIYKCTRVTWGGEWGRRGGDKGGGKNWTRVWEQRTVSKCSGLQVKCSCEIHITFFVSSLLVYSHQMSTTQLTSLLNISIQYQIRSKRKLLTLSTLLCFHIILRLLNSLFLHNSLTKHSMPQTLIFLKILQFCWNIWIVMVIIYYYVLVCFCRRGLHVWSHHTLPPVSQWAK